MFKNNSTAPARPDKPYAEFPLFPHGNGSWAKKIRGKLYYFGPWNDPDAALQKYLAEKDSLHAGKKPRQDLDSLTVKQLCNEFLNFKQTLVDAGELKKRTWQDYKDAADLVIDHFGKSRIVDDIGPDDFQDFRQRLSKRDWGPVMLGNAIQRIRVIFKFASDNGLVDRPIRYGQGFKRPSRKTLRLERAKKGPKLFTPTEITRMLEAASQPLKAMILLGINCGYGNADCGQLPLSALDLDTGWVDYPRPKTGIPRRCLLWPETIAAVRDYLENHRAQLSNEATGDSVFLTKYGRPWSKDSTDQTLAKEMAKLLRALGINGRKGLGFYTLRHSFRTAADEVAAHDQPAIDYIMGHESPHMASVYRERISDERLKAVVDSVHDWLFVKSSNE